MVNKIVKFIVLTFKTVLYNVALEIDGKKGGRKENKGFCRGTRKVITDTPVKKGSG